MAVVQTKYPTNFDTTALTITLASLAFDASLLTGRESTAIVNTTNLDLDHLVSGKFTLGTSPTAAKRIEVWVYAPVSIASGTPVYPDTITGTDGGRTLTSSNVKASMVRQLWASDTDATTGRAYYMPPTGVAQFFGGALPTHWGVFVTHSTAAALDATAGNHFIQYQRVQNSVV